jgi:hypothetical protein
VHTCPRAQLHQELFRLGYANRRYQMAIGCLSMRRKARAAQASAVVSICFFGALWS